MENMWDAVSAICAVLTGIGTFYSWRQAKGSKEAKVAAEEAENRAKEQFELARVQALAAQQSADATVSQAESAKESARLSADQLAEFRRIADSLNGPEFTLEHINKNKFLLSNNTNEDVVIEEVLNREKFYTIRNLDTPLELDPYGSVQPLIVRTSSKPGVSSLDLQIAGRDKPVSLQIIRH